MPFYIAWNALNHFLGEECQQRYFLGRKYFLQEGNQKGWRNHHLQKPQLKKVFQSAERQAEGLIKGTCELNTNPMQIIKWLVHNQARKLWHRICHEDENKYAGSHDSICIHEWLDLYGGTWPPHRALQSTHSSNVGMHSGSNEPSAEMFPWLLQFPLLSCTSALDQWNSNSHFQFFLFSPWKQSCFLPDTC